MSTEAQDADLDMSTEAQDDELDTWLEEHAREPGTPLDAPLPSKLEASDSGGKASEPEPEADLEITEGAVALPEAWAPVFASYEASLINAGKKQGGLGQLKTGARKAVAWLVSKGFMPQDVTTDQVAPLLSHIDATLKPPITYVFKRAAQGFIAEAVAMQTRAAQVVQPKAEPPKVVQPKKETRAVMPLEPTADETQEEQYDEQPEEPVEEAQPRRRASARQPQQVFVMPAPRAPRQAPRPPAGPSSAVARVLGKNTGTVRIHRRGQMGKRIYIEDIPVADITMPMPKFLAEFVEPDQVPDGSGMSTYEVSEVGPDNNEKGTPVTITVKSQVGAEQNEPLNQARQVMDFMAQIREEEEARKSHGSEVLKSAQRKAGETGDMNSLMMLMMMERMNQNAQGGSPETVALKLLEQFKQKPMSFDMPHYPPPPPAPVQMMPPPPPPPSELAPIVSQLLAATVNRPPEKSFMDSIKELQVIREAFMPAATAVSPELTILRAELAALRAQIQPAQAPGGIEGALKTFEQLSGVVKTLAPQINAGGITGALQGVLTPKLQAAVGDMLAGGIMGAKAAAQASAAQGQLSAGQQQVQPQQAQPQVQAPRSVPATVVPLVVALKAADTEPKQVAATMEVLQGYYADPGFTSIMEPALQALIGGNREPGVRLVLQVLTGHRPELAKVEFANKVIDALITSATGGAQSEPPVALVTPTPTVPLDAVVAPPPVATVEPTPPPVEVVSVPTEPVPQQTIDAQMTTPVYAAGVPTDPKDVPALMAEHTPTSVTAAPAAPVTTPTVPPARA